MVKDSGMLALGWTVDDSAWIVGVTQVKAAWTHGPPSPLLTPITSWTLSALASFGIEDEEMEQ